ncbi:NAD-dependent epimerase/dehydratase family protein [Pedobacter sp. 22226]|uniref:NAD-dependent epimerase/dehydratase family protein n=1 Tax=Pedobacter sp. 22226 TaxID=3453894 RepID=UPI003F85F98A
MIKLLIIGAKGFIGSHAYQHFKNTEEYITYASDIVNDYNDPNYFQISSSDADFTQLVRKLKPDWCINCAGAASVQDSFIKPLRDFSLNVNNVQKILFAIKEEHPSCKFIQVSSAAVYGNATKLPIEESATLNPLSPYGIHKKQAEELCETYHKYFGVNTYILRIFSAYGDGLTKQLFWDLYQKFNFENNTVTLFGTGNETRDFIHANDIVQCFEMIIKNAEVGFDIYNIANGKQLKIKDLVAVFKTLGNFDKKTVEFLGDNRTGDPLYWEADISKIVKLGYQSRISLNDGLKDYISWLRG